MALAEIPESDYVDPVLMYADGLMSGQEDVLYAVVALQVVAYFRQNDPQVLADWLDQRAVTIITDLLVRRNQLRRRIGGRTHLGRSRRKGGRVTLGLFEATHEIDDQHTRRPIGMMLKADHLFVAEKYELSATTNRMLASFHQAVANKVGNRRTSEVFTEEQYLALRYSIVTI